MSTGEWVLLVAVSFGAGLLTGILSQREELARLQRNIDGVCRMERQANQMAGKVVLMFDICHEKKQ